MSHLKTQKCVLNPVNYCLIRGGLRLLKLWSDYRFVVYRYWTPFNMLKVRYSTSVLGIRAVYLVVPGKVDVYLYLANAGQGLRYLP